MGLTRSALRAACKAVAKTTALRCRLRPFPSRLSGVNSGGYHSNVSIGNTYVRLLRLRSEHICAASEFIGHAQ
jgi:hypothetical protein